MFAVIVNPVSGGGEAVRLAQRVIAADRHATVEKAACLKPAATATRLARPAPALEAGLPKPSSVSAGTARSARRLGELCHTDATFYVVPGGTGNDFARAFHLPKDPMAAFESAAWRASRFEIDCGRMNGQSFLNVSGSGFDVAVLQKTEELKAVYPGEKAYRKAVLSVLGRYKAFEAELFRLTAARTTHEACTIVEIANGQ